MSRRASVGTLVLVGALALLAGPADAKAPQTTVTCGQTLTHSARLANDLTDCPGSGLVIGADRITVDLDGHVIDGVLAPGHCGPPFPAVFTRGIDNPGHDGVRIANGTVQQFFSGVGAGSDTDGMSDARVDHLLLRENVGGLEIGSGAGTAATAGNSIDHNVVVDSGCGGLELNTGENNRFSDNRVEHVGGPGIVICCGGAADDNVVENNVVSHTGDDDAAVLVFQSGRTQVVGNVLSDLGSDAIGVIGGMSRDSVVRGNTITRGQQQAIFVESCCEGDPIAIPTGVKITGNTLTATADGIQAFEADHVLISDNTITGIGTFGDPGWPGWGVILDGVSNVVVDRNLLSGGRGPAIQLGAAPEDNGSSRPVTGNRLTRNVAEGNSSDGIRILALARDTKLDRNTTDSNGGDGIHVLSPFTTLTRNRADRNALLGIEAVTGVTDGGGNRAAGNGTPEQCAGISCS